jgi:protein TonB
MSSYRLPQDDREKSKSLLFGALFAIGLFVVMALAQMLCEVEPPDNTLDETLVAYVPPVVEELVEEEPPPPEEKEPPPELDEAPPQLSLDQLDIALNPGVGGSLAGDFAMPTIGTSASDLGTEDFVDFSELDQLPRPIGVSGFNFPRRLKKNKVSGKIYLMIQLDERGNVTTAEVDSSSLPEFDDFVAGEVRGWRFTPPTKGGEPVKAQARLPIPININ